MLALDAKRLTEQYRQIYHLCLQEIDDAVKKREEETLIFLERDEAASIIPTLIDDGYDVQMFHGFVKVRW